MYESLRIIGKLIMDNLNKTGSNGKLINMVRTDSISVQTNIKRKPPIQIEILNFSEQIHDCEGMIKKRN